MSSEPIYFVDYIYTDYIDAQQILDIANLACQESGNHHVFKCRKFGQELVKLKHESEVAVAELRKAITLQCQHIYTIDKERTRVGFVKRAQHLQ